MAALAFASKVIGLTLREIRPLCLYVIRVCRCRRLWREFAVWTSYWRDRTDSRVNSSNWNRFSSQAWRPPLIVCAVRAFWENLWSPCGSEHKDRQTVTVKKND